MTRKVPLRPSRRPFYTEQIELSVPSNETGVALRTWITGGPFRGGNRRGCDFAAREYRNGPLYVNRGFQHFAANLHGIL